MNVIPYVEIIIKASIVALLAISVRQGVKKQLPAVRHMILLSALVGVLLIPVATSVVKFQTNVPLPTKFVSKAAHEPSNETSPTMAYPAQVKAVAPMRSEVPWSLIVGMAWLAGTALVTLRYAVGLASLRSIKRCSMLASDLPFDADALAQRNRVDYDWELRISSNQTLRTAMTWGLKHPVILLPCDAPTWTSARLEMILLHEFAHLRRRDFASQMLAELACALYWFNPIVWLSARAMREDAELAADEAVVSAGIRPSDYAAELLQIATTLGRRNSLLSRAGISNMTNPKIESRLKAILSSTAKRRGITVVNVFATLILSGIAVAGVASLKIQQAPKSESELQALALSRLKQVALGTYMYATDFDEYFPYVTNTKDAAKVTMPYIKNREVFKSPRQGADFRYNPNIAGVNIADLPAPAETIMWYEFTPAGVNPVVAYTDGHAKVIFPEDMESTKKRLKEKFPRRSSSKPVHGMGG